MDGKDLFVPIVVVSMALFIVGFVGVMRGDQRLAALMAAPIIIGGGFAVISLATNVGSNPLVNIPALVFVVAIVIAAVWRTRARARRAAAGADSEEIERLDRDVLNSTILMVMIPLLGALLLMVALIGYGVTRAIGS